MRLKIRFQTKQITDLGISYMEFHTTDINVADGCSVNDIVLAVVDYAVKNNVRGEIVLIENLGEDNVLVEEKV